MCENISQVAFHQLYWCCWEVINFLLFVLLHARKICTVGQSYTTPKSSFLCTWFGREINLCVCYAEQESNFSFSLCYHSSLYSFNNSRKMYTLTEFSYKTFVCIACLFECSWRRRYLCIMRNALSGSMLNYYYLERYLRF